MLGLGFGAGFWCWAMRLRHGVRGVGVTGDGIMGGW